MTVLMQAEDSVTHGTYTWQSADADGGAGYTGPNSPVNVRVASGKTNAQKKAAMPLFGAGRVYREAVDGSGPAGSVIELNLLDFVPSGTDTSAVNCVPFFAAYKAYLIANGLKRLNIPAGRYRIESTLAFDESALNGLVIQGATSYLESYSLGGGTTLLWYGATTSQISDPYASSSIGWGTASATLRSGSQCDARRKVAIRIDTGGTIGTSGIMYSISIDGGPGPADSPNSTYGTSTALGTATSIAVAHGGKTLTIDLGSGTLTTGATIYVDCWLYADAINLGQAYQEIRDLSVEVPSGQHMRFGCSWQRRIHSGGDGGMTRPKFNNFHVVDPTLSGHFEAAIAVCPDVERLASNYEWGIAHSVHSSGGSVAGMINFNLGGQALEWTVNDLYVYGTHPTMPCFGVYWASGNIRVRSANFTAVTWETNASGWEQNECSTGGTEASQALYYCSFGSPSFIHSVTNKRFAALDAASRLNLVADGASGVRTLQQVHIVGTGGDRRNIQLSFGSTALRSTISLRDCLFPNTDPVDYHDAWNHGGGAVQKITLSNCSGQGPANYTDLSTTESGSPRHIRSNQNPDINWVVDPHSAEVAFQYTAGPRIEPYAAAPTTSLRWFSDDGGPAFEIGTGSTGLLDIITSTATGGKQIRTNGGHYLMRANDTKSNPAGQSFMIWLVACSYAIGSAKCPIGKCHSGGTNNWRCVINATGHLELWWGQDAANKFTASTAAITVGVDQVLGWGLDRATNEVIYVVGGVVERHSVSVDGAAVFSNTDPVFLGCDPANDMPTKVGYTYAAMWTLTANNTILSTSRLTDSWINMHADQLSREFSI